MKARIRTSSSLSSYYVQVLILSVITSRLRRTVIDTYLIILFFCVDPDFVRHPLATPLLGDGHSPNVRICVQARMRPLGSLSTQKQLPIKNQQLSKQCSLLFGYTIKILRPYLFMHLVVHRSLIHDNIFGPRIFLHALNTQFLL